MGDALILIDAAPGVTTPAALAQNGIVAFKLILSAFPDGGMIPALHSCDGADLAPGLEWLGQPAGTKSFTLIVDDPDAPNGTWNHWLLYDIPCSLRNIAQGHKPGGGSIGVSGGIGVNGTNDFGREGYGGPCPPKGRGPHRYIFKLHALDVSSLGLVRGARRADIDRALAGHVLAEARYMGRYERK